MASPRRQRLRPDVRLPQILDAAVEEFAVRGYAGASMTAIAGRAGVAKGLLYHYFPAGKADLFRAAVRSCVQPAFAEAEAILASRAGSRRALLRALVDMAYARLTGQPRDQVLFRLIVSEADRFPEIAEFYQAEVLSPTFALVRAVLRAGVESGEFRPEALEQPGLPQVVLAPVLMASIWRMMLGEARSPDLDAMRDAHADLLVRALSA
ncbi:TetR/AcrR family transcriptional regulator [Roseomonas sp. NAR14]|uniref:TetR/AcrR family transcriptional regulator n=1 Tax=Roseomonas acroporae TaxID=2937791 RepID=A0A9X1Y6V8_9PROT|nr:TetR/AcrR family transcriptional regulator [Roseomonas acroporae]